MSTARRHNITKCQPKTKDVVRRVNRHASDYTTHTSILWDCASVW